MTAWTIQMRDVLRAEVVLCSTSAAGIATALNRQFNLDLTRNAVIGQMHRLGISKKRKVRYAARAPKPRRIERRSNHVITTKLIPLPPPPVIVVDIAAPRTDLISIFDLKPTSCRWPYGNEAPYLFCGATVCNGDSNNSYCRGHAQISYTKSTPRIDARPFHRAA